MPDVSYGLHEVISCLHVSLFICHKPIAVRCVARRSACPRSKRTKLTCRTRTRPSTWRASRTRRFVDDNHAQYIAGLRRCATSSVSAYIWRHHCCVAVLGEAAVGERQQGEEAQACQGAQRHRHHLPERLVQGIRACAEKPWVNREIVKSYVAKHCFRKTLIQVTASSWLRIADSYNLLSCLVLTLQWPSSTSHRSVSGRRRTWLRAVPSSG